MNSNYTENNSVISKYVRALYDVAKSEGIEKNVLEQIKSIKTYIAETKNNEEILKRASLIKNFGVEFVELLIKQLNLSTELQNLLNLLRINKRLLFIVDLCDGYIKFSEDIDGKKRFFVTTVEPISDLRKKELSDMLQDTFGGKIELNLREDPSIIGGIIVQYRSKILDYSVKSRIARLHDAIRRENYEN